MPEHVILDGGLDLVSARPAAKPGTLQDVFNYEVGFRHGYARIDGLERFDGQTSPSSTNAWRYYMVNADITGTFSPVETLAWAKDDRVGEAGVLLSVEDAGTHKGLFIVFRSTTVIPPDGAVVTGDESGASFTVDSATQDIRKLSDYYSTTQSYLAALDAFADLLRAEVNPVPGVGTIVGMHFHEDRLYAVRDSLNLTLTALNSTVQVRTGGLVLSPAGALAEILSYSPGDQTIQVHPLTDLGFAVAVNDKLTIPMWLRFEQGLGEIAVGDVAVGGTSGYSGTVLYVDLRNGSFDAGNAEGFMALSGVSGKYTVNETATVTGSGATFKPVAIYQQRFTDGSAEAATISAIATQSDTATLWKSTDTGWALAQSTRRMQFNTGTLDPTAVDYFDTATGYLFPHYFAQSGTPLYNWTGTLSDLGFSNDDGPTFTVNAASSGSYSSYFTTEEITVRDFRPQLSNDDEIIGIEVKVRLRGVAATGGTGGRLRVAHTAANGVTEEAYTTVTDTLWVDVIFGGIGALWGEVNLTPAMVNSSSFRFKLQGRTFAGGLEIDYVQVKYLIRQRFGQKMFLYNGTADVGWVRIKSVALDEGAWDGTGAGGMTLFDWSDPDPDIGLFIRTAAAGGGQLVGKVAGSARFPLLPGSAKLAEERSKYQFISYNFYASEEKNAIYGVSGAGPAFVFDGTTLDFISTGVERNNDRPRHVAAHQGRLALGYKWGEVYLSSSTSPLEFDALTLATSHGFGDKITGLMPLTGLALGVFTESTISVIFGAALDSEGTGVEQRMISPRSGAIEYTVQNLGNLPIFADFRGINMLQSTDQYGDFAADRLSYDVTPWLLSRLQRKAGYETIDESVVQSVVVRNKNQYRLFFADGYLLTLTLFGKERVPMCTVQRYWLGDNMDKFCRVFATASGVTSDGRDRVFVSAEDRFDVDMTAEAGFVYELDQGVSFDGDPIRSSFTLTHFFDQSAEMTKRFNTLQIHGYAAGVASLHLSRAINYESLDAPAMGFEPVLLGSEDESPEADLVPKYAKTRLTARGFALTVHIDHESAIEFPHIIQMLSFVDDSARRMDR
jgi:hypothetical protein